MRVDVAGALPQTEKVPEHNPTQSKADRGGAALAGRPRKGRGAEQTRKPDSKATPRAGGFARLARLEGGRAIENGDIKYNVGYISTATAGANITSLYIMLNIDNLIVCKHTVGEDWPQRHPEPQRAATPTFTPARADPHWRAGRTLAARTRGEARAGQRWKQT